MNEEYVTLATCYLIAYANYHIDRDLYKYFYYLRKINKGEEDE